MGQAKQRGTREQRIASAAPKAPKSSASDRMQAQAKALVQAVETVMRPIHALTDRPFH